MTKVEHDKECTRPQWSNVVGGCIYLTVIFIILMVVLVRGADSNSLEIGYNEGYCYAKGGTVIETYCNVNQTLIPIKRFGAGRAYTLLQ